MSSRPIEEMAGTILTIVMDHSGGLKFTELVTHLVADGYLDITPDQMLDVIRTDKDCKEDLAVLEYAWWWDNSHFRQKLFIYTPGPK